MMLTGRIVSSGCTIHRFDATMSYPLLRNAIPLSRMIFSLVSNCKYKTLLAFVALPINGSPRDTLNAKSNARNDFPTFGVPISCTMQGLGISSYTIQFVFGLDISTKPPNVTILKLILLLYILE